MVGFAGRLIEPEKFARDNGVLMYGMDEIMGRIPAPEISSVNQVI